MPETMQVECYAGSSYPQRPKVVVWQGRRLEIETVESQWREPQGVGFRVCTTDGQQLTLFYDAQQDCWQLKSY